MQHSRDSFINFLVEITKIQDCEFYFVTCGCISINSYPHTPTSVMSHVPCSVDESSLIAEQALSLKARGSVNNVVPNLYDFCSLSNLTVWRCCDLQGVSVICFEGVINRIKIINKLFLLMQIGIFLH